MRIGLVQRVLAGYRVPFLDMLAAEFDGQLSVYAGDPRPDEMIDQSQQLKTASFWHAEDLHLFSGKFYLCLQTDLLKWLKTWDPGVLILEGNRRYLLSPLASGWMRRRKRPVIGWGLGTGSGVGIPSARFLKNFDALITYSNSGAAAYRDAGFPQDRIFIAKNAVAPKPTVPMPNRFANGYDGKQPVVLYVGRLQERKRIDLLVRACAALPPEERPALWIVGDGPVRAKLEMLAGEILPETVFRGALYGEALAEVFRLADLFVLPGTGGLALQQAMSFGLPVVAAEADGTQADLIREENGVLIQAGDLSDLSATLRRLLVDPVRLRRMGAASYRIVSEEINLEAMTAKFCEAIRSVTFRNPDLEKDGPA